MVRKQIRIKKYSRIKNGKKEEVRSHDKNVNTRPQLSKSKTENVKKGEARHLKNLKCNYCKKSISKEEAIAVDKKIKELCEDDHEYLMDNFPKRKNYSKEIKKQFLHECDYGYDVINICKSCYNKNSY